MTFVLGSWKAAWARRTNSPSVPVLADVRFEAVEDIESARPVRMIRFMIAGDEEHSAELVELYGQEGKAVVLVRCNVAHVAKQRQGGCFWDD